MAPDLRPTATSGTLWYNTYLSTYNKQQQTLLVVVPLAWIEVNIGGVGCTYAVFLKFETQPE